MKIGIDPFNWVSPFRDETSGWWPTRGRLESTRSKSRSRIERILLASELVDGWERYEELLGREPPRSPSLFHQLAG